MTPGRRLRNIVGGSAGNLVEWFDWFVYASFAIYFSKAFFPSGDQTAQLLNTALVFAGGFIARPIGAWLMGLYADRAGRRAALTLSVAMMCGGSLLIALTPTGFGVASTSLLVLARLLQGLSVGGEYGASATYVSEAAAAESRGLWSGVLYATLVGGQLAAIVLQVILQAALSESQLYAWGWRIPFVVGAALAIFVFWLRRNIDETRTFETRSIETGSSATPRGIGWRVFVVYPRETALIVVITAATGTAFYTYTVYLQKFLVNTAGFAKPVASQLLTALLVAFALLQPAMGALSDRAGRKKTLVASFGVGAVLAVPVMSAIARTSEPLTAFMLALLPLIALSAATSVAAIYKAELFPAHVRAVGVALPYAIAQAVFGGNAETAALAFKKAGFEAGYFWLVAAILGIAFVVTLAMRDTKSHSLIRDA